MMRSQEVLLMTVARILRAKIKNEVYAERDDDLWALDEALSPFESEILSAIVNAGSK